MKNNNEKHEKSIYECSGNLEEKGYKYTTNGLYCPLTKDKYLEISRSDKKYSYSIAEYTNKTFNYLSSAYTCKESITEEKTSRTDKLSEYWGKIDNNTDIKPLLSSIAIDLKNESNFSQINATFSTYEKEKEKIRQLNIDSSGNPIDERKKPKLKSEDLKIVTRLEKQLKEKGLISFLNEQLDKLYIGKHTNMYRKLLGAFKIMRGEGSYLFETIAKAGEGKSLEDDIVFGLMIPKQYIYKVNSITKSSFTRYSEKSEYYFDRMILLFGDFGSRKSFSEMEELLNIIKVLITEKEYVRDLSDKSDDGNYSNKKLTLKCESIGGVYSSVINDFTGGDSQLESRTISSTPYGAKEERIMDFMIMLEYKNSQESKDKRKAERKLKKFQLYLLSCVNKEMIIINPYGEVFKRHSLHSEVPKRELKQVMELFDSYCKLTYFNCEDINGRMVASETQLNEFMQEICLENALIPYESDFLKMIMAKDNKTELTIVSEDNDEYDPLNHYFNEVIKKIDIKEIDSFSDLTHSSEEYAIKQLLKLYKLGGTSSEHRMNVFFRISDIRRHYSKYKAYKNVDDIKKLVHKLVKKGYIDSIEYQDGKQNIYYLTEQCNGITLPFELTDDDRASANDFLKKIGVIN